MTLPLPNKLKLIFLGDTLVGKSMLVEKFISFSDNDGILNPDNYTHLFD